MYRRPLLPRRRSRTIPVVAEGIGIAPDPIRFREVKPATIRHMSQPIAAAFELLDPSGAPIERGTAKAVLDVAPEEKRWALDLSGPVPLRVDLADVDGVWADDPLALRLHLVDGELILSQLGPHRDEFHRQLLAARRDLAADRLLLDEGAGGERFPGAFERGAFRGEGEIRVYLTRIAFLPDGGLPFAQGLGDVREVRFDSQRYGLDLHLLDGGLIRLGRLGRQTDPLRRLLDERLTALRQRAAAAIGALLPGLSAIPLRRVLNLLPDGVPATAASLDAVAPGTFSKLLHAAAGTRALAASFAHLASLAGEDAVIGIKETHSRLDDAAPAAVDEEEIETPGDGGEPEDAGCGGEEDPRDPLRGRAVFCVFPIPSKNALVVETGPRSGRATYVFRLAPPPELADLGPDAERALGRARATELGRLLVNLGFQREPLYRPEDRLLADGWKLALRRLPGLRDARARLVARVAHGPSWQAALEKALARAAG